MPPPPKKKTCSAPAPAPAAEEPLRHFLADVRALFPAFPTLLYRLLTALSATPDAAVAANACLAGLQALVCLHPAEELEGAVVVQVGRDNLFIN